MSINITFYQQFQRLLEIYIALTDVVDGSQQDVGSKGLVV